MKGIVDDLLKLFGIEERRAKLEVGNVDEFHPGRSAILKIDGKLAAVFGELHPLTKKKYHLEKENVVVLEMDLSVLFATKVGAKKVNEISRFPSVKRDFAVVLQDKVTSLEVVNEIKKVNRELINEVEVFDVYRGENIKEGFYSLAISVYLGSLEKTLNEQEVNNLETSIINALTVKFGAELRK